MDPHQVFTIVNTAVLPAWLLLAIAPGWRWTQRIVHAIWIPVLYGLVYAWAFAAGPPASEGASFGTLAGVMAFFTSSTAS